MLFRSSVCFRHCTSGCLTCNGSLDLKARQFDATYNSSSLWSMSKFYEPPPWHPVLPQEVLVDDAPLFSSSFDEILVYPPLKQHSPLAYHALDDFEAVDCKLNIPESHLAYTM